MTKVCRLCLQKLTRGAKYFNINAVESFSGFMPYRDQLTTCIPEMALDLIPNPVVCNSCRSALKTFYDFKTRCLLVEKRIREYVQLKPNEVNYDLSQINIVDLPSLNKMQSLQQKHEQSIGANLIDIIPVDCDNNSNDSTLSRELQKDSTSSVSGEVEIKKEKRKGNDSMQNCCKCQKKFATRNELASHMMQQHSDIFMCNFCNRAFKGLQYLRRHNSICSKRKRSDHEILVKRPHLPNRAKNHLRRWLFSHTDHPYPTDVEKQMLMQQTNLSLLQVENWFINARRRILQDITKLKRHSLRCEDNPLQLRFEEDVVIQERQKSPIIAEYCTINSISDSDDIEDAISATAIKKSQQIFVKLEKESEEEEDNDEIDIKIEPVDDR